MVPRCQLWPMIWKVCWNCQLKGILKLLGKIQSWKMYQHQVYQKKQRNTNQGHHVLGIPRRRYPVPGVRTNLIQTLRSSTNPGPQGKTSLLGSLHEAPWRHMLPACSWSCFTLPGSHGSTCYGLLILWPGMWPNGQSTMMLNCIIWCAMSTQVYRNVWLDGLATNLMIYHYPYSLMRILQVVHKPWDQHLGLICTYRGNKPASRCLEAANGRDA